MIVVCMKWVPLRVEVDSLTGVATTNEREFGVSMADQAALELALQIGEQRAEEVVALTVGGQRSDGALRLALAAGASSAERIEVENVSSAATANALAWRAVDASLIVCGDYSLDGGSATVPALIAAHRDWPQALGVAAVASTEPLVVVRRLDKGARELLAIEGPAVISVEGSVARLRRPSTTAVIAAQRAVFTVQRAPITADSATRKDDAITEPFRSPSRRIAPPSGSTRDRILAVTGVAAAAKSGRREIRMDPAPAAAAIIDQLDAWGYLSS